MRFKINQHRAWLVNGSTMLVGGRWLAITIEHYATLITYYPMKALNIFDGVS